jgi:hypothetical protein
MPKAKREARLKMPLSELVESVSKKPIPAWQKYLVFEIMANDPEGEDVEGALPLFDLPLTSAHWFAHSPIHSRSRAQLS